MEDKMVVERTEAMQRFMPGLEEFLRPPGAVVMEGLKAGWLAAGTSFALDLAPLVGTAKAAAQLIQERIW